MQQNGLITFRDVARGPTPAQPVPAAPFSLPPLIVAKLRALRSEYDAVLDTALVMEGYERGGCALDLKSGLVYPPGSFAQGGTNG